MKILLINLPRVFETEDFTTPVFILKEIWKSLFYPKILFYKIRTGLVMLYSIFLKKSPKYAK